MAQLTQEGLIAVRKKLNMALICEDAGLSYIRIMQKVYRGSEFTQDELERIEKALKPLHVTASSQ